MKEGGREAEVKRLRTEETYSAELIYDLAHRETEGGQVDKACQGEERKHEIAKNDKQMEEHEMTVHSGLPCF